MTTLDGRLGQALEGVDKGLLSDRVYAALREGILRGELAPGDRLVESEIARQMGISQAPVRDAFKRLSHETLVTTVPRRGTYVTEISEDEAAQARELRSTLEAFAASHAAARRAEGYTDHLRNLVERMYESAQRDDVLEFRELDVAFHRGVAHASGNVFVQKVWDILEPSLTSLRVVSDPTYAGLREALAEEHDRLLRLILEGRQAEAAAAFANHGVFPLSDS